MKSILLSKWILDFLKDKIPQLLKASLRSSPLKGMSAGGNRFRHVIYPGDSLFRQIRNCWRNNKIFGCVGSFPLSLWSKWEIDSFVRFFSFIFCLFRARKNLPHGGKEISHYSFFIRPDGAAVSLVFFVFVFKTGMVLSAKFCLCFDSLKPARTDWRLSFVSGFMDWIQSASENLMPSSCRGHLRLRVRLPQKSENSPCIPCRETSHWLQVHLLDQFWS